ncbi:MAG: hypothetical protein K2M93_00245 [Muribaculaceae bacterium]|nr:hypothetical protein [Muribaculaceae bacterium]
MKKDIIQIPENIRYMSQAAQILQNRLPFKGKYILDKSLTGCGGTEFFINSGRPLVLISPRTGVLLNKKSQHPKCHLFRNLIKKDVTQLKDDLRLYLDKCRSGIFGHSKTPIIFVTLDSAKYVIEELKFRDIIDNFLFLTDEFQCLISDAAFKGKVDLEFLSMLDAEAKNICYMSATPIDDTYLSALPEFQDVDYYKLEWHPSVIVEPTVKEIMMKKGESAQSIVTKIISGYRKDGFFARKIVNGVTCEAKESVFFINEVKTILQIIKDNSLLPDEVTVLISSSNKYADRLAKMGYKIENQSADRDNPKNTAFTFCSKASFEGRDFYSYSAFTYIFLDGTKDWEVHDTAIEIPQMLGRQRLDDNPFKYNALIYYRTKPVVQGKVEYMKAIEDKLKESRTLVDSFNNGDECLRKSLVNMVKNRDPNNQYLTNYLDVIDDVNGNYGLQTNLLVAVAEHNLACNKAHFYSNPLFLTTAIHNQMATYNAKTNELRNFEKNFNHSDSFKNRMELYSTFLTNNPNYMQVLLCNPFIEPKYHKYYDLLGPAELYRLNYDEQAIERELYNREIILQCQAYFERGRLYTAGEVKSALQSIYDNLGYKKTATANQLLDYIRVEIVQRTMPDGSRPRLFEIL